MECQIRGGIGYWQGYPLSVREAWKGGVGDLGAKVLWGLVVGMLGFGIGEGPRF